MASEMDEHKASLRENVLFYVTAFFCLVAIFSLFIFLFLVPFFIEPALTTIYMEFDPEPVMCKTKNATFRRGLSNCHWSSCREGCTKDVYECWQIYVRYLRPVSVGKDGSRPVRDQKIQPKSSLTYALLNEQSKKVPDGLGMSPASAGSSSISDEDRIQSVLPEEDETNEKEETYVLADQGSEGMHVYEAKLQPNVKGCGYPPDVECNLSNKSFVSTYGVVGANFSCYYSLIDPGLAITHLNIEKVRAELIYCLTIPIILFVISVVYLFYAYFKLYAEPMSSGTLPKGTSSHSSANFGSKQLGLSGGGSVVEGVVVSQPLSSPLHVGGKYGLLYQFPSPDTTRIVRRAKSGGAITLAAAAAAPGIPTKDNAATPFSGKKNPSEAVNNRGMRMSKSMGDSRRIATSPLVSPNPTCPKTSTVSTERSKEWMQASLGIRANISHQVHSSASPSEEEITLPV